MRFVSNVIRKRERWSILENVFMLYINNWVRIHILENLPYLKLWVQCPLSSWNEYFYRNDFKISLSEEQLLYLESFLFVEQFENSNRIFLWCKVCKKISFRSSKNNNFCKKCSNIKDKLLSKLKSGKLIFNSPEKQNNKSHLKSIKDFLKVCKSKYNRHLAIFSFGFIKIHSAYRTNSQMPSLLKVEK